ncbi:MAG: acetolactate synthase large subunit [Geminicoccaceae bacterium]|nr:acetolactate synthase large subunit [Geminicoccaceae bacterium]
MTGQKASDLFVKCLEAEGVTHIFGLPGEENADLMISLLDSDIRFILCRHEQAAAFMADTYGRLTGKPGVCLATLGPGATNLVTGIADANMDRAPLVAIIGQGSTSRLHKESHQNMDAIGMLRPVTKWGHSIANEKIVPEVVRKAFKLAHTEKPGATVIELPEDVAKRPVDLAPMRPLGTRRPSADHKAVARAAELIENAKSPLILAGNGAVRKRASKQLRRLAKKAGIPVVSTFMGKGAVSLDDPHCLFTIGLQGKDHVLEALYKADVIVSVGYDLVEYAPSFWNKGTEKKIVHVDFDFAEVDSDYRATVEIVADIADSLWQINERLNELGDDALPIFDIEKIQPLRRRIWSDLTAEAEDDSFPAKPQRLINDMRDALGPDDILLADVGAHKMWIARYYQCYQPNTCLISNGFCSMGFALPGAIGAKIAHPDKKVLAVCGDAGFLMNVQDLETAVRIGANFVVVVFDDSEYGLIKWKQQNQFDGRHSDLAFANPDFELLAKSFGMWGRRITATDQFADALVEAFAQKGPALIAVPVDYSENRKLTKRLGEIELAL